ncbi:response regulator transcription factor [Singulisphaera sp. PoT]|uniref:response regulator transcription factor n=1 Tax=Singulisphaera sp. PoT TaxID=3411797 RepID=UPI003BF557CB
MGIRILVIEDEANIADFLVRGLGEEGFNVEHLADGVAAWSALRSESWDLVLLDWWLPGLDGLSLLRKFRERDRQTPVLFLTARDNVQNRVQGLDSGADDYLCKPYDFDELLARVRALIRRRDNANGLVLSYRDVAVDVPAQRAEREGQPLDLTAKELALLTFFVRNPERVLSRTRIFEHVWGGGVDGPSKTLDVHVMELRRKLEAHGPRLIHTFRGRGYLFGTPPESEPGEGR